MFARGIIPIDLEKEKPKKRILEKRELIFYAKRWKGDVYFKSITLSVFYQEQGKDDILIFYNNNSSGMHPWGKKYPWGWAKYYWVRKPSGFVVLKEGKTKTYCPYFAFRLLEDNFLITYTIIYQRGIIDYRTYCLKWAGGWYDYKSVYEFNKRIQEFYYLLQN